MRLTPPVFARVLNSSEMYAEFSECVAFVLGLSDFERVALVMSVCLKTFQIATVLDGCVVWKKTFAMLVRWPRGTLQSRFEGSAQRSPISFRRTVRGRARIDSLGQDAAALAYAGQPVAHRSLPRPRLDRANKGGELRKGFKFRSQILPFA